MNEVKLKPCRRCGCTASVKLNCWGKYKVGCTNMFCRNWIYNDAEYKNRESAVNAWDESNKPLTPGGAIVPAGNERLRG